MDISMLQKSLRRMIAGIAVSIGMAFPQGVWVHVFNGTDASGLKAVTKGTLSVKNGILSGTGDCCGYFGPEKSYSHYRMKVEFQHVKGNSGFVWHTDKWLSGCRLPSGIELNINDAGISDIWWTDVGFKSTGASGFALGGEVTAKGGKFGCSDHSNYKSTVAASNGTKAWNTLELFVKGDSMEAKLNDKVWMRISHLESAKGVPLTKGKFGFLIEGNTMNIRSWQVMDLEGAAVGLDASKRMGSAGAKAHPGAEANGFYWRYPGLREGGFFRADGSWIH